MLVVLEIVSAKIIAFFELTGVNCVWLWNKAELPFTPYTNKLLLAPWAARN